MFLKYTAFTIAANLAFHCMDVPSGQQMEQMLRLSGYTAEEMNAYVLQDDGLTVEAVPSRRLAPSVFLLARVLYDAMADGTEWRGRKRTEDNPSLKRLQALAAYMEENRLLSICPAPPEDGGASGGEGSARTWTYPEYDEFVLRHGAFSARYTRIASEWNTAIADLNKESDALQDKWERTLVRALEQDRKQSRSAAPIVPFRSPGGPPTQPQDFLAVIGQPPHTGPAPLPLIDRSSLPPTDEALWALEMLNGDLTEKDAMPPAALERFIDRCMSTLPPEAQRQFKQTEEALKGVRESVERLKEDTDRRREAVEREQKGWMANEYMPAVAESAFRALLTGDDEIFKLNIGRYIWQDFMAESALPIPVISFQELPDEDDWDYVCPDINGKLALRIYDDTDLVTIETESDDDLKKVTLPLPSVLARYAYRAVSPTLYIRKSHVRRFREAGLSERKARDLAVVLATLAAVDGLETDAYRFEPEELYASTTETEAQSAKESPGQGTEPGDRAELERALKQAQKENQIGRHEISILCRENERLRQQLAAAKAGTKDETGDRDGQDDSGAQEEPVEYPYHTKLRIVLYGGFEVFHKELLKLLPDVRVVEYSAHIDTTPIRNADIVFLQINKTAHSGYYTVCDACKSCGIPYIHLNYASARRCADVMVREIRKREPTEAEV
ncbi:MAG: hypothetical protein LUD80_02540 [Clostridiales bacterium]|nr:hypothetical protein [Clostridiales bacterium]